MAHGLSLVAVSEGYSVFVVCGLLIAVASLVVEAWILGHIGSVAVAHRPRCPAAGGIVPDQGLNLCPWHWLVDS